MSSTLPTNRSTLLLASISAANICVGVALQFSGVVFLGAGPETDAYFAAQVLPLIAGTLISGALINNLVPMLVRMSAVEDRPFVRLVIVKGAFPLGVVFSTLAIGSVWWIPLLFPGANSQTIVLVAALSPLMCAIYALNCLSAAAIAGHYARGSFVRIEAVQLLVACGALGFAGFATETGGIVGFTHLQLVRAAVVGFVLATPFLFVKGRAHLAPLPQLWANMKQIMSGTAITKFGPLIDRTVASWAAPGLITSLSVGQQVISMSTSMSERLLTRPLLVAASRLVEGGEGALVMRTYQKQILLVLASAIAGTLLALALAFLIFRVDAKGATSLVASLGQLDIIVLTALVAIPAAAGQLSAALMYALGEVRAISRLAIITFVASCAVKVAGFFAIGAYAIVAGMLLYQTANWALMHRAASRIIKSGDFRRIGSSR